jgi:prevent-host-death family protein
MKETHMKPTQVGIREFKTHMSSYMRQVKDGATLVITEHGKPVGRMIPVTLSLEEQMKELIEAGLLAWDGNMLPAVSRVANTSGRSISDLLLDDRD